MRAIDTNVLVRLLAQDDPVQALLAAQLVRTEGPVWISHLVLMETVWVLETVFDLSRDRIANTIAALLDNTDLHLQDEAVVAMALERFKEASRVDFSDCLILQTARAAGHSPLVTFDKALARLPDARRLVQPPSRQSTARKRG